MSHYLFGDELITATELNRKPGKILDIAMKKPVTITRNNEAFALFRREIAQKMAAGYRDAQTVVDLFQALFLIRSESLKDDHPYGWLLVFDEEDHSQLVDELVIALHKQENIDVDSDGVTVETVIHEWRESALMIKNDLHHQAFQSRDSETNLPLTNPADLREEQ